MEGLRANADWALLTRKPFGVLMLAQTVLPLLILIGIFLAPFVYEGFPLVQMWCLSLLLISTFINLSHVFGFHRRAYMMGDRALFIPYTFILFIVSVVFLLLSSFATLLSLIAIFDAIKFTWRLILTYFFLGLLNAALTCVCGRLAILIFRVSPNSRVLALSTVILDGEKHSRLDQVPASAFTGVATTPSAHPPPPPLYSQPPL